MENANGRRKVRKAPIHIVFQEELQHYPETALRGLGNLLARYEGDSIEICLRERHLDQGLLWGVKRLKESLYVQSGAQQRCTYEIHTDGTGVTPETARMLAIERVRICLEMDGPREIHERNNRLLNRLSSHEAAVRAAGLLRANQVDFYIGVTVTSVVAAEVSRIFVYLLDNGWNTQGYCPAICAAGRGIGKELLPVKELLSVQEYGEFLKQLFVLWKEERMAGKPVYVRELENLAGVLKGYAPLSSCLAGRCPYQNVFLPDGGIISVEGVTGKRADELTGSVTGGKCRGCRWASLCQGDRTCAMNTALFCEVYQEFYPLVLPEMFELLRKLGR